ncbi:MAG TPA: ABC transporter substrate-binding protein [Verrucomicrobiae bacterium]|nr:ABC transporter substrate-binding protein [Verrucomicrobiae bacterium]
MRGRPRRRFWLGVLLPLLAACGTVAPPRVAVAGRGTVRWALPPGEVPNWIFPITPLASFSNVNTLQFQYLMYRPLYWFGGSGTPTFNPALSLADLPVYSRGGRTVTIHLKHALWSDGTRVTARDVRFWLDLLIADKSQWGVYVPGGWPDNVSAMAFPSPTTFSLTFRHAYNHTWLLYNELSQIVPLPQQAWDRTSLGGPVGNLDRTVAGAHRVFAFLTAQSKDLASYDTNPLWQVVDGPWRLARGDGYSAATGFTVLVPNPRASGPRPRLSRFEEVPFTSEAAEFDALRAGQLDYGYLPVADLAQRAYLAAHGFVLSPWTAWGIHFIPFNFTNPTTGPIFAQLAVRQALQHLIDEPRIVRDLYHGEAVPTYGPVPVQPATAFVSPGERHDPYPFDPAAARRLLAAHGWAVHPNGLSVCARPGIGAGRCGARIPRGAPLRFTLIWAPGSAVESAVVETLKSSFSSAGVQLALRSSTAAGADFAPCDRQTGSGCSWDLLDWSVGTYSITYSPDYYPTGGEDFATGAAFNAGGYSDPVANRLIQATHLSPGGSEFYRYEDYISTHLPVLWLPTAPAQLSEVSRRLHGALPQDPNLNIYPQLWSLSG